MAVLALVLLVAGPAAGQTPSRITLDQAIDLALAHNHALKAAGTLVEQSRAQETTAAIRPNPVFTMDYNFLPIFSSSFFSVPNEQRPLPEQFDAGINYTIERGRKRQFRIRAARNQTEVAGSQVRDIERILTFNVAQQFIAALLAQSNRELARQNLESFERTVNVSEMRYKAGDISKGDFLKIRLQLLQFQTDLSSAELALVQALASLRQLLGYDSVPADYDVVGELAYTPLRGNKEDFQARALGLRPDLRAAEQGVTAAQTAFQLARANAKRDLTASFLFSRVSPVRTASFGLNIEIPVFNRNQGEIARTGFVVTQTHETAISVSQTALTEVANAYDSARTSEKVVQLYLSGYLDQAKESREIAEFAYQRGAASLLDFLDAERSYRTTQLGYRQSLANYMLSLEQLRQAVGTRSLP